MLTFCVNVPSARWKLSFPSSVSYRNTKALHRSSRMFPVLQSSRILSVFASSTFSKELGRACFRTQRARSRTQGSSCACHCPHTKDSENLVSHIIMFPFANMYKSRIFVDADRGLSMVFSFEYSNHAGVTQMNEFATNRGEAWLGRHAPVRKK